jgi:uracil-DNA glycosylase
MMRVNQCVGCVDFPCAGVRRESYLVPDVEVKPDEITVVLISEAAPPDPRDYYYAKGGLFEQTTVQAFRDAGTQVSSVHDILKLGVYLTTAVKCGKAGYAVPTAAVRECSLILEKELALFPGAKAILLMGDIAIRAVNMLARRAGEPRVVPAGSTYKIRGGDFRFRGARAFPSYVQAGPSFYIEKSKRAMIAQDIAAALGASDG